MTGEEGICKNFGGSGYVLIDVQSQHLKSSVLWDGARGSVIV
jgi:hypothetical protein